MGALPSSSIPSSTKNATAASRSATTMPMLSSRWIATVAPASVGLVCSTDAAVGGGHVARRGGAVGTTVTQQDRACRAGRRRLEQRQVGGDGAAVEHRLPDAEDDRVDPQVEAV